MTHRLIVLLGCSLAACSGGGKEGASDTREGTGGGQLELFPPTGGQGTTMDVYLDANASILDYSATTVDMGEGITVLGVEVEDGFSARATIEIAEGATLGARDVVVGTRDESHTLGDSFTVVAESFQIEPATGRMGETLDVDFLGKNTAWAPGEAWPDFGDGVTVLDFTVLTENLATARISVDLEASPGWRDVTVDSGGGERATLWQGFKVDRTSLAATFDPPVAEQGDTVLFTIRSRGTDFTQGAPRLSFQDRFGDNADIVIDSVTVLDAENLRGQMTLSNAAALGDRDVSVQVGDEGVRIADAFEVIGGDWDISQVAIDLSFTVVRVRDNNTGAISEQVQASCMFYIPLDPPCPIPQETSCGDEVDNDSDGWIDCSDADCVEIGACPGPMPEGGEPAPYDANGVQEFPPSEGEVGDGPDDCPFPQTVPAGDFVWLESDDNVVTLVKTYDPDSGMVYYVGEGLTMLDYVENNWYDLHTQGEEGGIPEYVIPRVQPTVPADWEWVYPELWGNYTHNRAEDFVFQWTPASTYPDAIFAMSIFTQREPGPMSRDGYSGWGGAIPWDDGLHMMTASEMSRFAPGTVPVYAYSYIQGPTFGLPDSIYQENQAYSYIYLIQQMVLE